MKTILELPTDPNKSTYSEHYNNNIKINKTSINTTAASWVNYY